MADVMHQIAVALLPYGWPAAAIIAVVMYFWLRDCAMRLRYWRDRRDRG